MSKSTIRNFIIASLLLILTAGSFGLVYIKIFDEEITLKEQLKAIKIGNDREQTFYRLSALATESQSDRKQVQGYFLPQASESITFLSQVENLAPQNGVILKTDALEEGSDKKTKEKWIDASFTFSGARSDVERFIEILENMPYVARIDSVSLSVRAETNWEAKVKMRVYIASYEK